MGEPFIGSEAVASGQLTPYSLRSRFVAIYPDVYVPLDTEITAVIRAQAVWLWSRRRGVVAGQSAAALHKAKWVDGRRPAEILYDNRHPPSGIRTWADRVEDDEVEVVRGIRVTTPARTALDIACRYPVDSTVAAVGAHSRRLPSAADPDSGLRQIWRSRGRARHGWEDIKVAAEYDGDHHMDRRRFNTDIRRQEAVTELGWIDVRVTSLDTPGGIIRRVAAAFDRRV
jgi:hypothetical protein